MEGQQTAAAGGPKRKWVAFLPEIGLALAIAIVLWVVYGVLKKVGLFHTSEADKLKEKQEAKDQEEANKLETEKALQLTGNPVTDTNIFPSGKEFSNQYKFSVNEYYRYAKDIYDAKGVTWDDEAKAIAAIDAMPSKYCVKVLAYYLSQKPFQKNLLEYLKTFMDASQLASVSRSISRKPDFVPYLAETKKYMKDNKIKNFILK